MRTDIDEQLKQFFNEEVRLRREPPVRARGRGFGNKIVPLLLRMGAAAACMLLLWGSIHLRREHSLDYFIQREQLQRPLKRAFEASSYVVEIALIRDE